MLYNKWDLTHSFNLFNLQDVGIWPVSIWSSKKQGLDKIRLWATSGYHDVSGFTSQSFETSEIRPKFGHVSLAGYVRIF